MNPIRTALVGGVAAACSGHIAHAATASAPRLADFSLGEVIASIGTFAIVATGVSIAAGAAIGYIRDRAHVRRDRLAAEFDQMAIAAGRAAIRPDRRRSVAPASSTCTEVRA